MADSAAPIRQDLSNLNGEHSLEANLRELFDRQRQLRERLDATRAELDMVNEAVLRTQSEHCTTPQREEEYWQCLTRILGYDPRVDLSEIEEAMRNPHSMEDILAELERGSRS